MRAVSTHGQICLNDTYGFIYKIAKLEYTLWEDDSFRYVFTPNYSVVDLLSPKLFQGIPGLDLSCRKPQYVRMNRTPVFISERTPSEHREDLLSLLNECQMDHLNRLEWLIRTKSRYSGDDLYVLRFDPEEPTAVEVDDLSTLGPRGIDIIRKLLEILCAGKTFSSPDVVIDDVTRAQYYHLLLALLRSDNGRASTKPLPKAGTKEESPSRLRSLVFGRSSVIIGTANSLERQPHKSLALAIRPFTED